MEGEEDREGVRGTGRRRMRRGERGEEKRRERERRSKERGRGIRRA